MIAKCSNGSVCGGTQHVKDEETGKWAPCYCFFRSQQLRRLKTAEIPVSYADMTGSEAVVQAGYSRYLVGATDMQRYLHDVSGWLIKRPVEALLLPSDNPVDTFALGAYFAAQVAFAMDVMQANASWFVRREFSDSDAEKVGTSAPFLLLWGVGGDTSHAWLGPILYRILFGRLQHRKPTVIAFAPNGWTLTTTSLYGMQVVELLTKQRILRIGT